LFETVFERELFKVVLVHPGGRPPRLVFRTVRPDKHRAAAPRASLGGWGDYYSGWRLTHGTWCRRLLGQGMMLHTHTHEWPTWIREMSRLIWSNENWNCRLPQTTTEVDCRENAGETKNM